MRKYWEMAKMSMLDGLQNRGRVFVYVLYDFVPSFISILLWIGIFQFSGRLSSGWSLNQLVTYFLVFSAMTFLLSQHVEHPISTYHIKQGRLVNHLLKPFSYFAFVFVEEAGWKVTRLAISAGPLILLFFLFRHWWQLQIEFSTILLTGVFSLLSLMIIFFSKTVLGLVAFWTIDNWGLMNFFWMVQTLFSGALLPIDFLPPFLQTAARLLPFRFFYYVPTMILVDPAGADSFASDLVHAILWIVVLALASQLIFRLGLKRFTDTMQ